MAGSDEVDEDHPLGVQARTERVAVAGEHRARRFHLTGMDGARRWSSEAARCSIGSHERNDLVLHDPAVSRFHCELSADAAGVRLRDLGSSNGTTVDGVSVVDAFCRDGSTIGLGRTRLRLELDATHHRLPLSPRTEFGGLVGESPAMRAMFAALERVAGTASTVLIEGETGTGKEGAAEAIHAASPRRDGPFIVVDCSAIPPTLIESELFGHERGAFTGANARQVGAFEEASSGTIFLDEIGELGLELQPKLLRVLERREIRRVGAPTMLPVDVRVIAATHRDLRAEVNAGRFRADLYYRLAVVKIDTPPLRARPEDLPALVERFLVQLGADDTQREAFLAPSFLEALARAAWPGNVRELRNYVERCIVFHSPQPLETSHQEVGAVATRPPSWTALPYEDARRAALADFEASYLEFLLHQHGGNVANAARAAGIDRAYLYRLMRRRRHGS